MRTKRTTCKDCGAPSLAESSYYRKDGSPLLLARCRACENIRVLKHTATKRAATMSLQELSDVVEHQQKITEVYIALLKSRLEATSA